MHATNVFIILLQSMFSGIRDGTFDLRFNVSAVIHLKLDP
jgi:hypothetical protein